MQIEPEDILKIVIVCSLFSFAIGLLLGGWAGIGSEKARIKNMERAARRIVDYYNTMKLHVPFAEKVIPPFPPGPLNELYPSPENIKNNLESYIPLHKRPRKAK